MKKKHQIAPLPNRRLRSSAATAAATAQNKVSSTVPAKRSDLAPVRVTRARSLDSSLDVKKTVDFKRKGMKSEVKLVTEVTPTRSLRNRAVVVEKTVDFDKKVKKSEVTPTRSLRNRVVGDEVSSERRSLRNRDVVVDVLSPERGAVVPEEVSGSRRSRATQAEMLLRDRGEKMVKKRKLERAVIPRMALKKGKMSVVEAPTRRLTRSNEKAPSEASKGKVLKRSESPRRSTRSSIHVDAAEDGVVRSKPGSVERAEAQKRKLLVDQGSTRRSTRSSGGTEDIDAAREKLLKNSKPDSAALTKVSPSKHEKGKRSVHNESPRRFTRGSDISVPASSDEKVVKKNKPGKRVTNGSSRNKAVVAPAESRKPGKKQVTNRSPRSKASPAPADSRKPGKRATSKSASKGKGTRKFEGIHVGKNSKHLKPRKGSTVKKENLVKQDKKQPRASSVSGNSASTSKAPKEESQMVERSSRQSRRNAHDLDASVLGAIKSGEDKVMVDGKRLPLPSKRGLKRRGLEAPLMSEEQKDNRRQKQGGMEPESYLSSEVQVLNAGSNEFGVPLKSDACADPAAEDFTADLPMDVETQITGIVESDDLTQRIELKTQEPILPDNNVISPMSGLEMPNIVGEVYVHEIVEGSTVASQNCPNVEIEVERTKEAASDTHLDIKGNIHCSNTEQKVHSQITPPVISVETSAPPLMTSSCMTPGQTISGEVHEETYSRSELLSSSHIEEHCFSEIIGGNLGSENEGLTAPADAGDTPLETTTEINSCFATQTSCHQEGSIGSRTEDADNNLAGLSGTQVDCRNEEPTRGEALAAMLDTNSPPKGDSAEKCIGHAVEITFKPTYLSSGEGIDAEKGRNDEVGAESNVSHSILHNTGSDICCDDQVPVANTEPHSPTFLDESNLIKDPVFEVAEQLSTEDILDDSAMSHADLPHFDCSKHREQHDVPVADRELPSLSFFEESNQIEGPVFEVAEQLNVEDVLADENANSLPHAVGSKHREQPDVLDATGTDTTFHVSRSLNGFEDMEVTDLEGSDCLNIGSVPNTMVGATSVGNESAIHAINVEGELYNYTETVSGRQVEDAETYHSAIDDDSFTDAIPCEDDCLNIGSVPNTMVGATLVGNENATHAINVEGELYNYTETVSGRQVEDAQTYHSAIDEDSFTDAIPCEDDCLNIGSVPNTMVGATSEGNESATHAINVDGELYNYTETVSDRQVEDAQTYHSAIDDDSFDAIPCEDDSKSSKITTILGTSFSYEPAEDVQVSAQETSDCSKISSVAKAMDGATKVGCLTEDKMSSPQSLSVDRELHTYTENQVSIIHVTDAEPLESNIPIERQSSVALQDEFDVNEVVTDLGASLSWERSIDVEVTTPESPSFFNVSSGTEAISGATSVERLNVDYNGTQLSLNADSEVDKCTETLDFSRQVVDVEPCDSRINDCGKFCEVFHNDGGNKSNEVSNTVGGKFDLEDQVFCRQVVHVEPDETAINYHGIINDVIQTEGKSIETEIFSRRSVDIEPYESPINDHGILNDVNQYEDINKNNEETNTIGASFSYRLPEHGDASFSDALVHENDEKCIERANTVDASLPCISAEHGDGTFTNVLQYVDGRGDKSNEVTNAVGALLSCGPDGHEVDNFTDAQPYGGDDICNEGIPIVGASFSCEPAEHGVDRTANQFPLDGDTKFDSHPQVLSKQVADAEPCESILHGEGNFTNVVLCEDGDKCNEVTNTIGTSVSSGPAEVVEVSSVEVPGLNICSDSNTLPGGT